MIEYDPRRWREHFFDLRGSVVREIGWRVAGVAVFALVAAALELRGYKLSISDRGHLVVGPALALLLVFRTNAANDRYWEGRRLWGGIVNSARNLGRKAAALVPAQRALIAEWTILFVWATRGRLRDVVELGPRPVLPATEIEAARGSRHAALFAADRLTTIIAEARQAGTVSDIQQSMLDADVQALVDHLGGCERIHSTPLPFAYAVHLRRALVLYCCSLPFTLLPTFGVYTVPVTLLIAYVMMGIEEIGSEIEEPFGTDANDLPLDRICESIANQLRDEPEKP
jgi:ion channel-forming bestrophin family protein